jgi:nondiscriminating aspartyl-tRNA synthetase
MVKYEVLLGLPQPLRNQITGRIDTMKRSFISALGDQIDREVIINGWVHRLRVLSSSTFVIVKDCTGIVQCVGGTERLADAHLKLDDAIEVRGTVRKDARSKIGYEIHISAVTVLNRSANLLPFNSSSDLKVVGPESLLDYRPLALRNPWFGSIFRLQGAILRYLRDFLHQNHFTEIISSKIVASGTEGGTNLFEIKYFDRVAYLAQSPQFYKEHGVAGFERVFETGHVYRAEPHASSRHLTEYYSLDLEMGFISGPEDVIQLERELLTSIFSRINQDYAEILELHGAPQLPSMLNVPIWEFDDCLERLKSQFQRTDLVDDLDPEGERQLCQLAKDETGVSAVFVLGYPLAARPFYTHPRGTQGAANSFDLLLNGVEITTGGQRLHRREDLEAALRKRGIQPEAFEPHLRMFELGMPPHGGFAIGLERLTSQILGLQNIRNASLYPRDRYRVTP